MNKKRWIIILIILGIVVVALIVATLVLTGDLSGQDSPPSITSLPINTADPVSITIGYTSVHPGVDFSAHQNIAVVAPCDGVFHKDMYFHAGVPRWQVNAEIRLGKYAVELLFESGDSVTEAQAQTQYDMLLEDGTPVQAGDLLGSLYLAPGQPRAYLHLAVRWSPTGEFFCPLSYLSPQVKADMLELYFESFPGGQLCYDQSN